MPPYSSLKSTAHHEAGHAVAAMVEGVGFKRVTIEPDGDAYGRIFFHKTRGTLDEYNITPAAVARMEKRIVVSFAGGIAERKSRGVKGRWNHVGSSGDAHHAVDGAELLYSGEVLEKYLAFLFARAKVLIDNPWNWAGVTALAEALLEHKTLSGTRAMSVIRDAWSAHQADIAAQ